MRYPLSRTKRSSNIMRMKAVSGKNKKVPEQQKEEKDYISETISFVIKGKLTPIKPTFITKPSTTMTKKSPVKKVVVPIKKRPTPKTEIKAKVTKKNTTNKEQNSKIVDSPTKTVKKNSASITKTTKKNTSATSNTTTETNSIVTTPDSVTSKKDTKEKTTGNKNDATETKKTATTKAIKKVKPDVAVVKKKAKKDVSVPATKRTKSPQKSDDKQKSIKQETIDKKAEDIQKKQTIEKLLKQANRALKQPMKTKSVKKVKKIKDIEKKETKPNKSELNKIITKVVKTDTKEKPVKATKRKLQQDNSAENTPITSPVIKQEIESLDIKTEETNKPSDNLKKSPKAKKLKVKNEEVKSSPRAAQNKRPKKLPPKSNLVLLKKRLISGAKDNIKRKENIRARKMKLFNFWNGPKRHRVASLNALAKVHCLYENETRGALLDTVATPVEVTKKEKEDVQQEESKSTSETNVPCTRTLRSVPGLRAVGKHWDMHDTTSSSEDNSGYESTNEVEEVKPKPKVKKEPKTKNEEKKTEQKRRRNRTELIMDLKDMVVRKRMASLNASAILAASYSVEKRTATKNSKGESETEDSSDYFVTDTEDEIGKKSFDGKVKKEDDSKLIEVRATPNKKVAVILNQDTDVTITGVYVNSTTRSTHHEGYCSIAGMQYRISATSHTQTAATAVATETLLQSSSSSTQENSNSESLNSCKSYTPLDALSNMQPPSGPGIQHGPPHQHMGPPQHVLPLGQHQLSPNRRHGCPSAFSTPHPGPYPPPPPAHHHPPPPPSMPGEPGYVHGYYQPAGPLINVPHGHTQPPPPITKNAPLSEVSPTSASPIHQPPAPPSSNGDSSDSEVIITSVTQAKEPPPPPPQQPTAGTYRYTQYPGTPPGYSYGYPPHYYPATPPAPSFAHHDLCYSAAPYLHPKYQPPNYRRYLPSTQYYAPNTADIYASPSSGPTQQSQQVVTATPVSASGTTFQQPPGGPPPPTILESYPPPPPTLVETYPHPPHYYSTYAPAPPPSCYTHSPAATRTIPYLNTTYQSCPCPMQSCPKNVHTGPLTGDSKRSNMTTIAKDSMPLPPVALALPLEPASATGPPSPARGSAGMPPPPSPAGATYQPPPPAPKQESRSPDIPTESTVVEKKRKARVGKAMVRNNIAAIQQNTMLLMCNPVQRTGFPSEVKREIESPKEKETETTKKEICSDDESKIKIITPTTNIQQIEIDTLERITEPQNLKKEAKDKEDKVDEEVTPENQEQLKEQESPKEDLPPCINTVAENVKVKNMKRKLSISKEKTNNTTTVVTTAATEVDEPSSPKKIKLEKYPNGSYKNLIKKDNSTTVKINNGKRKLIRNSSEALKNKNIKSKKKQAVKRKSSTVISKESETPAKRSKCTKPLAINNSQNSKSNNINNNNNNNNNNIIKDKILTEELTLIENKEPVAPTQKKVSRKSTSVNSKKSSAAVLDNLISKNNIDKTIDSVIEGIRTNSTSVLKVKCSKSSIINNNNNNNNNINNNNNEPVLNRKSTNKSGGGQQIKIQKECRKGVVNRRKSKNGKEVVPQPITKVPRRSLQLPRWSNGWTWEGEPYDAKVFLNSDETTVVRKCYPAMRHEEGDIIEVRDCVLLKAGPRKNDLPFVAKIAYLWENPDDGEMMMSLLWYYRPEHTEQGRLPTDQPDEVFASRHKDSNSVACIDDKCYVLTFHEYCRYRKQLRRLEEGIEESTPCISIPEPYPRNNRQPPSPFAVTSDMVFFCRRVYDFRQKRIVKNPS